MKNKRGDLPITILVIGVFMICSLALLSFINATISVNKDFDGINLIQKIKAQKERHDFDQNRADLELDETGKFYYQEKEKSFFGFNERIIFSVKLPFP